MDRNRINTLMDRASSGDVGAFGCLSGLAQDEVFRLALALGLRAEDAAEATQETFLRAYGDRRLWKGGSDALGWLCGIAVNVVREQRRQERRKSAWMKERLDESAANSWPAKARGVGEILEPDQLQHLAAALDDLPPRQREAIACRYLRQMSIRETAGAMGCAEGTVKSCVAAALEKLQAVLECHHETH